MTGVTIMNTSYSFGKINLMKNIISVFAILISGCTSPADPYTYREEIVVKAALYAGEGIDSIKISKTVPLDQAYDIQSAGVTNAVVEIQSGTGEITALSPVHGKPGTYSDSLFIIKPNTTYFLTVNVPGFEKITGKTTTPDVFTQLTQNKNNFSFSADALNKDSLVVSWNEVANNNFYLVSTTYIGPDSSAIEISKENDDEPGTKEDQKTRSIYTKQTRFRAVGFFHKYYGSFRMTVTAMDINLFNYSNTQFQDKRELNEPTFSVKNAIGYFASGSRKKVYYEVLK